MTSSLVVYKSSKGCEIRKQQKNTSSCTVVNPLPVLFHIQLGVGMQPADIQLRTWASTCSHMTLYSDTVKTPSSPSLLLLATSVVKYLNTFGI